MEITKTLDGHEVILANAGFNPDWKKSGDKRILFEEMDAYIDGMKSITVSVPVAVPADKFYASTGEVDLNEDTPRVKDVALIGDGNDDDIHTYMNPLMKEDVSEETWESFLLVEDAIRDLTPEELVEIFQD